MVLKKLFLLTCILKEVKVKRSSLYGEKSLKPPSIPALEEPVTRQVGQSVSQLPHLEFLKWRRSSSSHVDIFIVIEHLHDLNLCIFSF